VTVFEHQTPVGKPPKGPEHRTTIFSTILCGGLDRADDAQTDINLVSFYCMDFEKNESEVWIYHPL